MIKMDLNDIYDFCASVCELIDENKRLKDANGRLEQEVESYRQNLHETVEFQKKSIAHLLQLSMEKWQQEKSETKDLETKDVLMEIKEDACRGCVYKNCSYVGESPCLNCEKSGSLNAVTAAEYKEEKNGIICSVNERGA